MASESVVDQEVQAEAWLEPIRMMDDSIFTGWAMAVSDLLACCPVDATDDKTTARAGGLTYALVDMAERYQQSKLDRMRKIAQAAREAAGEAA